MGLSGYERDILLRIAALDEASPVLNQVANNMGRISGAFKNFGKGLAFTMIGSQIQDLGKKMLDVSKSAVDMAINFNEGMARVQTQAQLGDAAFNRLSNSALRSAGRYGQGFETINDGLYDIFSSTDLGAHRAMDAVNKFAEAATAGGTDVRTVSRSALAEMNALGKGAGSLQYILDNQFQAVRKGVFTYSEFASAVGNMLPYAASADQSLKTLTGSMAFMSRNGFTASQSAISVARALDSLMRKRPEIKDVLGVDIVDKATGDYKSLGNIMGEFSKKMEGMTGPQIQKTLSDIFGAGEIRANRFFRTAIPRFDSLNKRIHEMGGDDVAGQMDKAFNIMKKTPAVQWQILIEKARGLAIMLGNALLPAFQELINIVRPILNWFRQLSPETQKWIAIGFTLAGALLYIAGTGMKLIGAFYMLQSALQIADMTIGGLMATMGIWLVAIIAIAAAAYIIYRNWDTIKAFLIKAWNMISDAVLSAWNVIKGIGIAIGNWVFDYIINPLWQGIKLYIAIWTQIFTTTWTILQAIWNVLTSVWGAIWGFLQPILGFIWDLIKNVFTDIWESISFVAKVIITVWQGLWALMWGITKATVVVLWAIIKTAFEIGFKIIVGLIKFAWQWWMLYWHALVAVWHAVGEPLIKAVGWIWNRWLYPIVKTVLNALGVAWHALWSVLKTVWNAVGRPVFDAVKTAFKAVWDFLVNGFHFISDHWASFWTDVKNIFFGIVNGILSGIESFVNGIIDAINWVRTKFGLDAMGHVTLSRVGTSGGSGVGTGGGGSHGHGRLAEGTPNWRGGWAWVGERGPELAYLPRGTAVIPNNAAMMFNAATSLPAFGKGLLSGTVVSSALKAVGVHMPQFPGAFNEIGIGIMQSVTDWFKSALTYILGNSQAYQGGDVTRSGWQYLHMGERVQPARVVRNLGGGGRGPTELHVHIEPRKANVDERDLVNELDWYRRTGLITSGG